MVAMVDGQDYYELLGLPKGCHDEDAIKRAYRKMALKWHPDKNRNNTAHAESMFKRVSEAYEVLSDPQKREIYDRYGEAGLKGGMGGPAGANPFSGASAGAGAGGVSFSPSDAEEIFRRVFGGAGSVFFASGLDDDGVGGLRRPRGRQGRGGPGGGMFNFQSMGNLFGGGGGGVRMARGMGMSDGADDGVPDDPFASFMRDRSGAGRRERRESMAPRTVVSKLPCTLEELYKGCTKKLKVTRKVQDSESGQVMEVSKVLTIDVQPGWRAGKRVTFPGEGDELNNEPAQTLVFEIEEKPHAHFQRDGDNLRLRIPVSLKQALCGLTMQVPLLSGQTYDLEVRDVITPGTTRVVPGGGMPRQDGGKGDLAIVFDVRFPASLTAQQREQLKQIL